MTMLIQPATFAAEYSEKVFDLLLFYVNLLQCMGQDNCGSPQTTVLLCDINIRKGLQLCQELEVL